MYPIILRTGTEKNELALLISAFAAICFMCLIAAVLSPATGGMNLRHPLVGMVSIFAAVGMFLVSFAVSVNILTSEVEDVRFEDVHFADSLLTLSYRITKRG